jgi:uncharacterized short protein YbdD (DUF466 family)
MNRKTICILTLIIGLVVFTGIVSAFYGLGFMNEDSRSKIKQAIENSDYNAWRNAMIETLTQENFNKLVEKYKTMIERRKLQDAVRQAIESGDYEAYKEAMQKFIGSFKIMSEEDFNTLVQRYKAGELGRFCFTRGRFGRHLIPW